MKFDYTARITYDEVQTAILMRLHKLARDNKDNVPEDFNDFRDNFVAHAMKNPDSAAAGPPQPIVPDFYLVVARK